jgi:Amt family ammonium transporter
MKMFFDGKLRDKRIPIFGFLVGLLFLPVHVSADELNSGDTAWMLVATVLVLFMTVPGVALF